MYTAHSAATAKVSVIALECHLNGCHARSEVQYIKNCNPDCQAALILAIVLDRLLLLSKHCKLLDDCQTVGRGKRFLDFTCRFADQSGISSIKHSQRRQS